MTRTTSAMGVLLVLVTMGEACEKQGAPTRSQLADAGGPPSPSGVTPIGGRFSAASGPAITGERPPSTGGATSTGLATTGGPTPIGNVTQGGRPTSTGGTGATGGARSGDSPLATGGTPTTGGSTAKGGSTATAGSSSALACPGATYDASNPPKTLSLSGNLGTHDPVMALVDGKYYEYQTGFGILGKTSTDLLNWTGTAAQLSPLPAWVGQTLTGVTELWAPDISYFGNQFHLYYSASTFGTNTSCIGHATRDSLTSGQWADQGRVICSNVSTSDNWNAIDPNIVLDALGAPWLAFGSFWSGIKIVQLNNQGQRTDTNPVTAIAARPGNGGALEAPFIIRRCDYYYLFVSFDACCRGVDSTYNIRVGRSKSVTGPYADKAGTPMLQGGGSAVVEGNTRWKGPGHNALLIDGAKTYNVYHAYDANANGDATLRISELAWDSDGWPVSAGP